jgi:hypothetical protein
MVERPRFCTTRWCTTAVVTVRCCALGIFLGRLPDRREHCRLTKRISTVIISCVRCILSIHWIASAHALKCAAEVLPVKLFVCSHQRSWFHFGPYHLTLDARFMASNFWNSRHRFGLITQEEVRYSPRVSQDSLKFKHLGGLS